MKRPRIVLADDHALIPAGIRGLLESFCELVREVADGRSLVTAALELRPDLVILDITMPLLNGIEGVYRPRPDHPGSLSRNGLVIVGRYRAVECEHRSGRQLAHLLRRIGIGVEIGFGSGKWSRRSWIRFATRRE